MAAPDYLLFETATGYAVFQVILRSDAVGNRLKMVQEAAQVGFTWVLSSHASLTVREDLAKFGKMVSLCSFAPFANAAEALSNANDISEGIVSPALKSLLELNLPKASKKHKVVLGVADRSLAGNIKNEFPGLECETGETSEIVADMLRGIRQHAQKLLKQLQEGDVERAQLGLGHAVSRSRVKFSVNRSDNQIIQAIATLDHLDKAINMFSMRVREWYSWHFPELIRIVSENYLYAKLALLIGDKSSIGDGSLHDVAAVVGDDAGVAQSIIDAAKVSMGQEIGEQDMANIMTFASRVVALTEFRKRLHAYLVAKMAVVAPNLSGKRALDQIVNRA
jgi:nucleolar protein 56